MISFTNLCRLGILCLTFSVGAMVSAHPSHDEQTLQYFYLRCNSTGWDINAASQNMLEPAETPDVFELTFEVRQPTALNEGDPCIVTETNERQKWGTKQQEYRLSKNLIEAPGTAWIYSMQNSAVENANFRIKFKSLGTYKVRLYQKENLFVISKVDAPAFAGDMLWSVPGQMMNDKNNDIFRLSQIWDDSSQRLSGVIAKVDAKTGVDAWHFRSPLHSVSLQPECIYKDLLITTIDKDIVALRKDNGRISWKNDINRLTEAQYPILRLSCPAEGDYVFASYGQNENRKFAVLKKNDGSALWSLENYDLFYNNTFTPYRLILLNTKSEVSSSHDHTKEIAAYHIVNGKRIWTTDVPADSTLHIDDHERIFVSGYNTISRLNSQDGSILWKITAKDRWLTPTFEHQATYIASGNLFERINVETGTTLWSYQATPDNFIHTTSLKSDKLFAKDGQKILLLDSQSGKELWHRDYTGTRDFPDIYTDDRDTLYISIGATLIRLDETDGTEMWRFTLPFSPDATLEPLRPSIGGVVDSDEHSIYVTYNGPGYRCQPMGLVSLNRDNGQINWESKQTSPIWVSSSDTDSLYITEGCIGPSIFKAIKK